MTTLNNLDFPALVGCSPHGWHGVAGDERGVSFVTIGHRSAGEVERCLEHAQGGEHWVISSVVRDAADDIARFLDGEPVNLNRIPVHSAARTPFQQRVVAALRRIPYGETVTYAELAELAGAPSAARAVGTVMSRNRVPLLIPCHRVVGSGGQLGGFSAPTGVSLKRALLDMESGADVALHS